MILANLIVGGAPKCATSSVFKWLSDHSDIVGANPKETFFLMDINNPFINRTLNYYSHGLEGYSHFFNQASRGKYFLDGTTHYLYQNTALEVLSRLPEQPNIIFVLRKPSDRLYSAYRYKINNQAVINQNVNFSDFIEAIFSLDFDSIVSEPLPKVLFALKNEIEYGHYSKYLARWYECFDADKIKILLFEDIKRSPKEILSRVVSSLNLDPSFYDSYEFNSNNITISIKNNWLHRKVKQFSRAIPSSSLKSNFGEVYRGLQASNMYRDNHEKDLKTINYLDKHYLSEILELEKLCKIDFSSWKNIISD